MIQYFRACVHASACVCVCSFDRSCAIAVFPQSYDRAAPCRNSSPRVCQRKERAKTIYDSICSDCSGQTSCFAHNEKKKKKRKTQITRSGTQHNQTPSSDSTMTRPTYTVNTMATAIASLQGLNFVKTFFFR